MRKYGVIAVVVMVLCFCMTFFGCSISDLQYSKVFQGIVIPHELTEYVFFNGLPEGSKTIHKAQLEIIDFQLVDSDIAIRAQVNENGQQHPINLKGKLLLNPSSDRRLLVGQVKDETNHYTVKECFVKDKGNYEGLIYGEQDEPSFAIHLEDKSGNLLVFEISFSELSDSVIEGLDSINTPAAQILIPNYSLFHRPCFIEMIGQKGSAIITPNDIRFNPILANLENAVDVPLNELDRNLSEGEIESYSNKSFVLYYKGDVISQYLFAPHKEQKTIGYDRMMFSLEGGLLVPHSKEGGWQKPIGQLAANQYLTGTLEDATK